MKKISKTELLAILAATGVSNSTIAIASTPDANQSNSLGKVEHSGPRYLADESKCGKGSCGKDEKGAAEAKKKHAEKKVKKEIKKEEKKEEKKEAAPQAN